MSYTHVLLAIAGCALAASCGHGQRPVMRKQLTGEASYLVYAPEGWKVSEQAEGGCRTITATSPDGQCEASLYYGISLTPHSAVAAARRLLEQLEARFGQVKLGRCYQARDAQAGSRIVFDARYVHPQRGQREMRCWVSVHGWEFICSRIEAPQGELAQHRQLLLTVLANVRLLKGAVELPKNVILAAMAPYRLRDGSASFLLPEGWKCHDLGSACFVATAPDGPYSFMVASVEVLGPNLGVYVPGVLVSDYLPPHQALKFAAERQGIAQDMRFVEVKRRVDLEGQVQRMYTAGPVTVEEFVHTSTSREGRKVQGYTFGMSFGSRLGTNWRFWHITAVAPADQFSAFLPTMCAMLHSYSISEDWRNAYIAQGLARLRQLQKETMRLVARNAEEIRRINYEAFRNRMESWDYIDYQRTNYIRGQQDWISTVEGGVVYHTDAWGTQNTSTLEYHAGTPYDYVHFQGQNPRYEELMTPIDSRELWRRYIQQPGP